MTSIPSRRTGGVSIHRRHFIRLSTSAAAFCTTPLAAANQTKNRRQSESLVTDAAQTAIDSGLQYLADQQNEDGTFGSSDLARNVGVCSLAGLAWVANGGTPTRGKYGNNTLRCVDYALKNCDPSGFIRTQQSVDRRPMYGHGFATMLLCLTHGTYPSSATNRSKVSAAVKTILTSQNEQGGWRYEPTRNDADVSVTACQLTALRAAKNAGFYVPKATITKAEDYIRSCQNDDGGFAYQPDTGASEFARSAAALVALYNAGIYSDPAVDRCLDYLHQSADENLGATHEYFYYGIFYAAQAMWQSGSDHWNRWFPAIRDRLVSLQTESNSWVDPVGPAYATAVALIVLQMENGYVPLFQK